MEPLNKAVIKTQYGDKNIAVFSCDIVDFPEEIDILTFSAFYRSYKPTPRTMVRALYDNGISVSHLAHDPEIDMRNLCNVWLSKEITDAELNIHRLGCIEMSSYKGNDVGDGSNKLLPTLHAYFNMLDTASEFGVKMDTVAMPLLGAGSQGISVKLTIIPILSECISFLKRNKYVKNIYIVEKNQANAFNMALALEKSYSVLCENMSRSTSFEVKEKNSSLVFISYSTKDKNIAESLGAKLEVKGVKAWFAPRDIISGDYAGAIVSAITKCTHFIVIISKNSLQSQHVLNEIDLAFRELNRNIKFMPIRIDDEEFAPSFTYYLSSRHWIDAHIPPIEVRIDEFVEKILAEME